MPVNYARRLIGRERTVDANRHLGFALAFVAGATNAGGYLAVRQYTSHMTGVVSSMADHLALGEAGLVLYGAGSLLSFVAGAASSALMVHWARRHQLHSEYALPLLVESSLMLCFGLLGARLAQVQGLFVPLTVMLLCFIMGLQNALVSKLSNAEIRTTHMTGIVTDIGIELGRALYWNQAADSPPVVANRDRLRALSLLVLMFGGGGVVGALGFKHVGYAATIWLALALVLLASVPAIDDMRAWWRRK